MKYLISSLVLSLLGTSAPSYAQVVDDLPPRLKAKALFESSTTPADLSDFPVLNESGKRQECIVYLPQYTVKALPIQFRRVDIEASPKTPIFPNGLVKPTLQSSFLDELRVEYRADNEYTFYRNDETELYVRNLADFTFPGAEQDTFVMIDYKFRKSGDYIVFSMKLDGSFYDANYGYCWTPEN